MNDLRKCKFEELGVFDLESVCDVAFATTLGGVMKDKV